MKDLSTIRKEYTKNKLSVKSVHSDPITQFSTWMNEAITSDVLEPNAMHLATQSVKGSVPSSRIVLLKGIKDGSLLFYTNYQSQKGKELENNPACSLNFFWPELERQVSIKGIATRISPEASDLYFKTRPRGSQLSAWVSPQSAMVKERAVLEDRKRKIEHRYKDREHIPRPKQWGGYQIDPYEMQFWQGREDRLHDRILYHRQEKEWLIYRLAP